MNCLECEALLQKRLDGAPSSNSDALAAHLSECAKCRENHSAAQQMQDALAQLPKPRLAPDFAKKLASQVMHDRRHRQDKMRRRVLVTMALAASVLLMLVMAYLWVPRTPTNELKNDFVEEKSKKIEPPKKEPEPETKHAKQKDAPQPFVGLPERMADATRDHAQVFWVGANLDGIDKLPAVQDLQMLDPGMREAGEEVTEGVRVVTRNARKAFDFFAREMPMPENLIKGD
jgi:hypothetical protein